MRKILSTLMLLLTVAFLSFGQDIKPIDPINFKNLQSPSFSYFLTDSSVWIYKGSTYGWTKLHGASHIQKYYVPYEGAIRYVNLDTMGIKAGYVDFAQKEAPAHSPYRMFADTTNHTLAFYNDEEDITLQVGQEMWSRIYNDGLVTITNGTVVRITGSFGGIATIGLASNYLHSDADGVLGVITHNVESNTYGFVTTVGEVHDLNTAACPEGEIVYLGIDGALTSTRPVAPLFSIEIGTCLVSDAINGIILVNIKGSPYDIVHNSFNSIFLESMVFRVISNGTTTTGTLERRGGGDLTMQFSDGFTTLDCTPAQTVTLTAGTAHIPQTNYVYVLASNKTLTASTSGWPSEEHIKVSEVACRTSALTQTDGVLRNQNWNDHVAGDNGTGHISHINERIRRLNADWYSGVTPTLTIVSASNPDNVLFSNTGGKVYQMHLQDFPAQSMPTNDIHIVNHFTTPFTTVTDLNTQLTDALGATLASKSYSLVIWGVQNETGELSHLMCNLPIGSYLSAANAIKDADNYSVYTIPNQFKGVGFLIARITLSHNPSSSGTWTLEQVQDLRGYIPNNTAGGGAAGAGVGVETYLELLDTPNSYVGAANKLQGVNSGETALEHKGVTATLGGTVNIPTGQQYQINGGSIIIDAINDGVTTTAPSQNAVYDALALKENTLTKGNLTAGSSRVTIGGNGTGSLIGTGASVDVNEGNIVHQNISGAGTNTHAQIDTHITNDGDLSATNEIQAPTLIGNTLGLTQTTTTVDLSAYVNPATGNLTESITGLEFSATRQVIGGAADLSMTAGYQIPTTTQVADITHTNRAALDAVSGVNTGDQTIPTALPTPNALTMNNSGTGDASGATFNGSGAKTISYNTIGAAPASGSGNYIQNQNSVAQGGSAWVNGILKAGSTFNISIGESTGTEIRYSRAGLNYITVPIGGSLLHTIGAVTSMRLFENQALFAVPIVTNAGIQATTAKLTNLTDGYIPYHISDASGFGNSSAHYNGSVMSIGGIGGFPWSSSLEVQSNFHIYDGASSSFGLRFGFLSNVPYLQGYRETVGVIDLRIQPSGGSTIFGGSVDATGYKQSTVDLRLSPLRSGFQGASGTIPVSSGATTDFEWKTPLTAFGGDFIQNQFSTAQSANQWILGKGRFDDGVTLGYNSSLRAINSFGFEVPMVFHQGATNNTVIYPAASGRYVAFSNFANNENNVLIADNGEVTVRGAATFASTINSTGYLLNNNNLFSSLSSGYLPYWDGGKLNNSMLYTNPLSFLTEVIGNSSSNLVFRDYTSNYDRGILFKNNTPETIFGSITFNASSGYMDFTAGYSGWGGDQRFFTNGVERQRINSSGKIIISDLSTGSTRLVTALADGTLSTTTLSTGANLSTTTSTTTVTINSDTGTDAVIPAATTGAAGVMTSSDKTKLDGITNYSGWILRDNGASGINIASGGFANFTGSGNISISRGTYTITIDGSALVPYTGATGNATLGAYTWTASNFILSSDRRLKQNIKPLKNTSWVNDIDFFEFTMKSDSAKTKRFGVIAQDVEKVAPELVTTDKDGMKAVSYIDMLIAKVSEMDKKIKELEKRIEKIEKK